MVRVSAAWDTTRLSSAAVCTMSCRSRGCLSCSRPPRSRIHRRIVVNGPRRGLLHLGVSLIGSWNVWALRVLGWHLSWSVLTRPMNLIMLPLRLWRLRLRMWRLRMRWRRWRRRLLWELNRSLGRAPSWTGCGLAALGRTRGWHWRPRRDGIEGARSGGVVHVALSLCIHLWTRHRGPGLLGRRPLAGNLSRAFAAPLIIRRPPLIGLLRVGISRPIVVSRAGVRLAWIVC